MKVGSRPREQPVCSGIERRRLQKWGLQEESHVRILFVLFSQAESNTGRGLQLCWQLWRELGMVHRKTNQAEPK